MRSSRFTVVGRGGFRCTGRFYDVSAFKWPFTFPIHKPKLLEYDKSILHLPVPNDSHTHDDMGSSATCDIGIHKDEDPVQPLLNPFPKTVFGSQTRCFSAAWYTQFSFLEYSQKNNLAFCFVCRFFSTKKSKLTSGYSNWLNALRGFKVHWDSPQHIFAQEKYSAYRISKTVGAVLSEIDSHRKGIVAKN